uniref:Uncharacterized protein n=1 Tax=Megaselia scalaris TaxID=36166 RepID=T1GFZ5_MEGSC
MCKRLKPHFIIGPYQCGFIPGKLTTDLMTTSSNTNFLFRYLDYPKALPVVVDSVFKAAVLNLR